jgi:hypothetical protein
MRPYRPNHLSSGAGRMIVAASRMEKMMASRFMALTSAALTSCFMVSKSPLMSWSSETSKRALSRSRLWISG